MGIMTTTPLPRRHTTLVTDLGDLLAVAEGDALAGLYFPVHWHPPADDQIGPRVSPTGDAVFEATARELAEYLRGERTTFGVTTVTHGDAFSERVWDLLMTIGYGTTTTYGAIARELGNPGLAQRVGQAVGHNPVSILIPCHRVIGADGSLTGYAGGLDRKARLLALEEPAESSRVPPLLTTAPLSGHPIKGRSTRPANSGGADVYRVTR